MCSLTELIMIAASFMLSRHKPVSYELLADFDKESVIGHFIPLAAETTELQRNPFPRSWVYMDSQDLSCQNLVLALAA